MGTTKLIKQNDSLEFTVSAKKIMQFLSKFGFKTKVVHEPRRAFSTYSIISVDDNTVVFKGNYKAYKRWIFSLAVIYERMIRKELISEIGKSHLVETNNDTESGAAA